MKFKRPKTDAMPSPNRRLFLMMGVIAAGFVVLIARLWYLQIVEGEDHAYRSDTQKLHEERLTGPRGRIFARDQREGEVVLADTRPARDVIVIPAECEDPQAVSSDLASLLNIDGAKLEAEIRDHLDGILPYEQIFVKRDISRWELGKLSEASYSLPGVHVMVRPQRTYLHGKTAGQLLGFLGEIDEDELKRMKPDYKMGDVIGKTGLELLHEATLRGQDGSVIVSRYASKFSRPQLTTDDIGTPSVAMDTRGRELREMSRKDPVPGDSLHLTIDLELQQEAERLLAINELGNVGSLVAMNANTGEILAMASSPGYDPNVFVSRGRSSERMELLQDKTRPMEHRAYRNQYPPGSVFKIAMAVAALEEGIITKDTHISCHGYYKDYGIRCWRYRFGGHGSVNVIDALSQSCDVFFYEVGLQMTRTIVNGQTEYDVDRIHAWGERFALGVPTGIDLLGELPGLVPTKTWKRESVGPGGEPWEYKIYPAEIAMISIGQSFVQSTSLQSAQLMAMVLNGGRRVTPYVNANRGANISDPVCSPETIALIQEGLRRCVEDEIAPSGTGVIAQIDGLDVLAKTGTAQIVNRSVQERYGEEEDIPYKFRDHAWFVAGVMDREPPLAVCAMIEHGHHGNTAAGPVARELLRFFYERPAPQTDYSRPITVALNEDAQ